MKTILYFSPTGNARYVAAKLSQFVGADGAEPQALEFLDPADLTPQDELIIVYSVHAFNPPRTVKRFVKETPSGLYRRVSIICVGCTESWVNKAASLGLRKILAKKGYAIGLDEIVAMPLTFIMPFPEQMIQKQISAADKKIKFLADFGAGDAGDDSKVSFWSKLIHFLGKAESPAARFFGLELHADGRCTSCGLCVDNCPEKNIHFNKKEKPQFGLNCLMCMRCVYNCPEKAIAPRLSKFIPIKGGYDLDAHLEKKQS